MPDALHAQLVHGDVPPSLNKIGGHSHWTTWRKHKQQWQSDIEILLMEAKVPRGLAVVEASAVLRFPQKRRRDEGNFRALLEKSLGDALTNGGWLSDDTPDQYRFFALEIDPEKGPKRTIIRLKITQ